ncbi:hypothetical protein [Lysinibacillus sp. NPDC086135]|uniref:hypothetical protein n=1 Tax=Lysinibacillus sp. NPDC086135 TaxID=3364130 RepID=UPI0038283DA2
MFNELMSVKEMDNVLQQKKYETGYGIDELVKNLTNTELKLYDKKFKEENHIVGEITSDNMKLISPIGHYIFTEKLNRDRNKVFGNLF